MNNLFAHESKVRLLLGMLMLVGFTHLEWWAGVPMGALLTLTGAFEFCPIYQLLHINSKKAQQAFYLAQLPKYNPEPVLIFKQTGEIAFRNPAANSIFPEMTHIEHLLPDDPRPVQNIVEQESNIVISRACDQTGRTYAFHFRGVKEINSILAYAFNISEIIEINQEIISTQKELVYRLGEIGETRSKETGYHVKRVAEYSYLLATLSGLSEEEAQLIKMASPMHDIGKIAIPDIVLNKPGKLDSDEWETMKTHAAIGHELLHKSDRPILKAAAIVAYEHHEKWDGSGYPRALQGEDIHIFGRITAIADVFDALGSARVYKPAWPLDQTLAFFHAEQGRHFDPYLVDLVFKNLDRFLAIRDRYQDIPAESVSK